jgi:DNA-binding response OmpR family regulator
MIVHDDAEVASGMGCLLEQYGFSLLMIDDARSVRAAVHQEQPSAVVLVQQHPLSTVIWDSLQLLWLDRAINATPIVRCLYELEDLSHLMARLRRNCAVVLPLPMPDRMLVAALSAVVRTPVTHQSRHGQCSHG